MPVALPDSCLHTLFRARARAAPERVAVTARPGFLTYGDLDARSDRVAARLAARGVGRDVLVALCAPRGLDAVVGMLGILKAGGAYVPVDPGYPAERVEYLLTDCAAPVVVATSASAEALAGTGPDPVLLDDDADALDLPVPDPAVGATDLAYVIYTSGSTGRPKGVTVEHRNVVRLFEQTATWFGFDEHDVWAQFHSLSFDFSVWEVWGALLHGGRLVVLPETTARAPLALVALLRAEGVTVLNQTPSAFAQLLTVLFAPRQPAHVTDGLALRHVVFGGERLQPRLLRPWVERHGDRRPALANMYGITETTVHCTYRRITAADLDDEGSPIGVPIPDLRLHLLDTTGAPVPDGEPGEVYVAGGGVARGYLDRPELTATRFLTDPPGLGEERVYRTGDRAVRLPDGELTYAGRVDDQLKVRGFRIEPGEVELCLCRVPGVGRAVVAAREVATDDVRLVAYLLPEGGSPPTGAEGSAAGLAAAAERRAMAQLPRHVRPSLYEVVSEMPMTPQGKVDRDALGQ